MEFGWNPTPCARAIGGVQLALESALPGGPGGIIQYGELDGVDHTCLGVRDSYRRGMDQAILEREAMKLSLADRALLADALLSSLDDAASHEVQSEWSRLAEERYANYNAGKLPSCDGPEVIRTLRERHFQ